MTKTRAASVSIVSNVFLTVLKLACGIAIGSMAVLSEALHSATDLLAALMAYLSVRMSSQPEDDLHPYGHGKFEDMAAAFEGLILVGAASWIAWGAVVDLVRGGGPLHVDAGLVVMTVSLVVNSAVSWFLFVQAHRHESVALEADAWHLSTDALTSLGVIVGLGLVKVTGSPVFDGLAALLVAVVIGVVGVRLGLRSARNLVDTRLPATDVAVIEDVLRRMSSPGTTFHGLRTRKAGPDRHIDLHLAVRPETTMGEAHDLSHRVEHALRQRLPTARVLIHLEPQQCPGEVVSLTPPPPADRRSGSG